MRLLFKIGVTLYYTANSSVCLLDLYVAPTFNFNLISNAYTTSTTSYTNTDVFSHHE